MVSEITMVNRLIRFFRIIIDDMAIPKESIFPLIASCGIGIPVILGIVLGLGWIACWIFDKPFGEDAVPAGVGMLALIGLILCVVEYMAKTWKKTSHDT